MTAMSDKSEKKQLLLRGDLNDLYDGKLPLRNPKYVEALKAEYGKALDGKTIWLFEITEHNGKLDPTIFPGIIHMITDEEGEISVNEAEMEYLSESKQFKDYSLADVVGEEWAVSLQKSGL